MIEVVRVAPIVLFSLLAHVTTSEAQGDAGVVAEAPPLPPEHVPRVGQTLSPQQAVTGDAVKLTIRAESPVGDDVTIPEQSFAPLEVLNKRVRVEPDKNGRQVFVFELELLALQSGKHTLSPVELRVVTKDGFVGSTKTAPLALEVKALLGNEPNAKLKPETKPVVVVQDDYTLLYVLGALAGTALIALATWLFARYWQRRVKPAPPPPPPRPPWDIAVEKLAELRRRKQAMLEQNRGTQFVDEVSDVVRQYLGGCFGFDGLETTTDEMLDLLRVHRASPGLWQEVAAYLRRCDLVKFAKVVPDQDEADLVLAKAQDIVQFSMPMGDLAGAGPTAHSAPSAGDQPP